ncbi:sigma-54-dependent transcriptional regulator [Paracoccus methylarcula]|uniref:Sigma-54-dependent Fis family transcriptional regulator n=1 Tax=Paracoccus methylarcula TaxID=72022 RepID=A0A422QUW4_9RHOB|nr:sigma-54 dependent transcriptional regulator [Paracoccus methylarcula]RNF33602.1 sigma-54-dependent Fis family transcriptional regulator [Paracoccus methylarcula]
MSERKIFVIDDDAAMLKSLLQLLSKAGWDVKCFERAQAALDRLEAEDPNVILCDMQMPGMSGLELLAGIRSRRAVPVVLISAHGDIPTAVQAIQDGAYSFLEKPYDPRRLLGIVRNAAEKDNLRRQTEIMREQIGRLSGLDRILIGNDRQISVLRDQVMQFASIDNPLLISGETGTGKELVARSLHSLGSRMGFPFVALNCATLSQERFEEQVFGVADGNAGLIRRAEGGVMFLDEIGACPAQIQAKFLRVIEHHSFTPIGSDEELTADLRIIASTNEDLEAKVTAGEFRQDLLYRINALSLHLPPLRDRGEDVIILFDHFLRDLAAVYEIDQPELLPGELSDLLSHGWPGNVRELRHVANRRILAATRGGGSVSEAMSRQSGEDPPPGTLRDAVAALERSIIGQSIRNHDGRMDAVAEALGIGRRTLNEKMVKLGLDKAHILR